VVTTYKRDGTAVATTVNVVASGDHAYFRTWSTAGRQNGCVATRDC
jgi:hypothetical protein